ncbi:MAG: FtsX-like permease family protein [Clostridia bacterium]|nr:FtsX-like permease family protein [Clostridia bacterium]
MSILLKHILRNIKENKGRSILIVVALTIATIVLVLNITLPNELLLKVRETLRSIYGKTDISISTVEPFKIEDINLGDEKINYVGYSQIEMESEKKEAILIKGVDIEKAISLNILGEDVPILKDNEIVVSKKVAEKSGYKHGDILKLKYNNLDYELKIVKIIDKKGITSIDVENDLFISNINTVNEIKKIDIEKYEGLYIDVENNDKINSVRDYLKENNDNYIIERLVDEEVIREQTSMVNYIMILIFAMATIMIYFVISSLNKIIIAERLPVIGTFRSIGATKGRMNLILILENSCYGLISGIIGSLVGNLLNSKVASLFITTNGMELTNKTSNMSLGIIFIGIAFAVILQIVISTKEILKANKKPIKDIIFNTQNSRYKIRKARTIFGIIMIIFAFLLNYINNKTQIVLTLISLVSFIVGTANIVPMLMQMISKILHTIFRKIGFPTGMIASKNIGYNKMIISSSRLIVVALSLMITIITVSSSITNFFNSFRYTTQDYNIVVQYVSKTSEKYDKLANIGGIKKVDYMNMFYDERTTYNGKNFKNSYIPIMLGLSDSEVYIKELNYKIKDLKYNEILVDEKFAEKNEINKGDILKLKFENINKEIEYKVMGFVNSTYFSASRNVIITNLQNFLDNLTGIPAQIHLKCDDNADLEKIKEKVKDDIKEVGIKIQTVEEYISEQEEQTNSILSIFYIILGLAIILSFIGIVNNQIIGFLQRKRELAVLNSTCMSKNQINNMMAFEIILSNLISCSIAVLAGFLATGIVDKFMQGLSLYVDISFDFISTLKFVGTIYIILLLTLIIPSKRLRKMNIVNEIKYE